MEQLHARAARIAAGLSLEQAARAARIRPSHLAECERRQQFSWYRANLLARAYGCALDVFLPQGDHHRTPQGRGRRGNRPRPVPGNGGRRG